MLYLQTQEGKMTTLYFGKKLPSPPQWQLKSKHWPILNHHSIRVVLTLWQTCNFLLHIGVVKPPHRLCSILPSEGSSCPQLSQLSWNLDGFSLSFSVFPLLPPGLCRNYPLTRPGLPATLRCVTALRSHPTPALPATQLWVLQGQLVALLHH